MDKKLTSTIVGGFLLGAAAAITAIKIRVRKNEVEECEE